MRRHATTLAAALLVLAAVAYGIAAAARGHSARAEPPPDLSTGALGLDVWRVLRYWAEAPSETAIVDLRDQESWAAFHLPGSVHLPGADAAAIRDATPARRLLVVGQTDAAAATVADELGQPPAVRKVRFLVGGAAAWFLALELPTRLFAEQSPPRGWLEARDALRRWVAAPRPFDAELQRALELLAATPYEPTALGARKPAAAPGKKKKLSGGCG